MKFFKLFISLLIVGLFFRFPSKVSAATYTWDGGGETNNWSDADNWNFDIVPGAGDVIIFSDNSTKNATIDSSFGGTVQQVVIFPAYSGTITAARTLTITGSSGYTQSAGTVDMNSFDMTTTRFNFGGGTFTAPSGTLTATGLFTVYGSFHNNGGTILLNGSGEAAITCNNQDPFNLVVFAKTTPATISIDSCTVPVGNNVVINQDGTDQTFMNLDAGAILKGTGTIDLSHLSLAVNGAAGMTGFTPGQTLNVTTLSLRQNVSQTTLSAFTSIQSNQISIQGDNVDLSGFDSIEAATFLATSDSYTITAPDYLKITSFFLQYGGDFIPNGGTVEFVGLNTYIAGSATGKTFTFSHLILNDPGSFTYFGSGNTYVITDDFTVTGEDGQPITLISYDMSTNFEIDAQGARTLEHVRVNFSDSINETAMSGTDIQLSQGDLYGNQTTNWIFNSSPSPTPTPSPSGNSSSQSVNTEPARPASCNDQKPFGSPDLFQVDIKGNSATLYFSPVGNANQYYYINYSDDASQYGVQFDGSSEGVQSYTINMLQPNMSYDFTVRGGNGCMPGDWGNTMSAKAGKSKSFYKGWW